MDALPRRAPGYAAAIHAIGGSVAPGFEEVRREFERNFAERRELGAACAAYVGGEKVVDLWGGVRDARDGAPWAQDTVVVLYSTSKGLSAMNLALAHARGWLDYDELVTAYWPEFGQAGKEKVTVRQLLGHEAGLPVIDEPLDPRLLSDFDGLAAAIARQRPLWPPGTRHGYHGVSLGWYEGELIRRIDPSRRTLGRFFADEVAGPLHLDVYFGLPEDVPQERIARIERVPPWKALPQLHHLPPRMVAGMLNPRSVTYRTFANPRLRNFAELDRSEYRRLEFPAGGAIGTARAVAGAYSAFSGARFPLGLSADTIAELARFPLPSPRGWFDEVLKVETAFSLGFARPLGPFRFGSSQRAFGHPGAGGSFAFVDPDRDVSFAYVMNRLGFHLNDDPREKALRDALYRSLEAGEEATRRGARTARLPQVRVGSVLLIACGLSLAGCFHPPAGQLRQDLEYRIRDLTFAELRAHGSAVGLPVRAVQAIHVTCFPQRRDEFACGVRVVARDGRAYRERWRARYLAGSRDERVSRISGSVLGEARQAHAQGTAAPGP